MRRRSNRDRYSLLTSTAPYKERATIEKPTPLLHRMTMHTTAEALPELLDELRTAIVKAGMFTYSRPDPLITILLDEMELPEGVRIILTVLVPEDLTDCPPQRIEAALTRMWSRVLGVDWIRTTSSEKGSPLRPGDPAVPWVPQACADAASGPYARVQGMSASDESRIAPPVAWSSMPRVARTGPPMHMEGANKMTESSAAVRAEPIGGSPDEPVPPLRVVEPGNHGRLQKLR